MNNMNKRKIALAGLAFAVIGVLAALGAWALAETVTAEGGNSITSPDTTGSGGYHTSLALDASGFPVVIYTDSSGGDLNVMHCNDANCDGGDESVTSPDTTGRVGASASLELDASGYPVVSYYDNTNDDLKVMHCNDPNCDGNDESITSPDTDGDVGAFTSLALDASGYPVISYYDVTNGDLKVIHCNDPDCAGGDESITSPDTAGDVGASTSLALDASGYPVVSYWDRTALDMKLLHCDDPDCSGDGESITMPGFEPLPDRKSGGGNSLALDASGNPVVGYCIYSLVAVADCAMFVVHCNDPDCAGGDESITRRGHGVIGGPISLVLDAFGNPAISFRWASPNIEHKLLDVGLAVMRCNDPDCGGFSDFSVVGSWGVSSSLALDASGYPVVSYAGGRGLNVLHCGDPLCVAGKPVPTVLVGDASCDGVVNAQDAALILQLAAGLSESLPCPEGGDVNDDGEVTTIDAALILQFSAGLIGSLPP